MGDRTQERLWGLSSGFMPRAFWLVTIARRHGLPVVISEGTRSFADQQRFVRLGLSQTLKGKHLGGNAIDIDMLGFSPDSVPQEVWDWMGLLGEALGMRWGGRWQSLRDFRHFERI